MPEPCLGNYDVILINSSGGKAMLDKVCTIAAEHGVLDRVTVLHCNLGHVEPVLVVAQLLGPILFLRLTGLRPVTPADCERVVDDFQGGGSQLAVNRRRDGQGWGRGGKPYWRASAALSSRWVTMRSRNEVAAATVARVIDGARSNPWSRSA